MPFNTLRLLKDRAFAIGRVTSTADKHRLLRFIILTWRSRKLRENRRAKEANNTLTYL